MKDAHEEDADAQRNGSHQVEVASHGFLNLGDLVGAVLPGVVLAEGLELLVDPGQARVKSGGDGDEASKGGLKKGEEDVHEAPVLRARSPVANDAQDEDDDSKTESALHRDSSEGDLPDVRVLLAVNIARGSHENDGHYLCVSFVSKERREREREKRG